MPARQLSTTEVGGPHPENTAQLSPVEPELYYQILEWKERWEAVLNKSSQIFYDWQPLTNDITYIGNVAGLLGYQPPELGGRLKYWTKFIHPVDQDRFKRAIKRTRSRKKTLSLKYRVRRKDGSYIAVQDCAHCFLDRAGKVHIAGIMTDITEHVKEKNILQEREKRYRELVESQQELIVRVDPKGRFTFVNDAYCYKFGKTRKELVGSTFVSFIYRDDLTSLLESLRGLESPPYRSYIELRASTAQGWRWIGWENYAIKNDRGQTVEIQAIGRDITDRKQTLEKLKSRTEDLEITKALLEEDKLKSEALLASIGDGIIATDKYGAITRLNKVAEHMLGWKLADVLGRQVNEVIRMENEKGEHIPRDKRPDSQALSTGKKTIAAIYYYLRKDGTKFPAEITATPVIRDRKIVGTIEVFRDITKEVEIDRAKSEFVSLASHQLRTPLATIIWYAEAWLKRFSKAIGGVQKEYLEEIYNATQRMIDLVDNFLNVSRIELGTFAFDPEPLNIIDTVRGVLTELEQEIKEKNLIIEERYDQMIPILHADPHHMHIVFQNLLTNAVKYTPTQGCIGIEIRGQKDKIFIKLSDTGCGIPKYQQSKVFTKLFRGDNVKEKDTRGTGLGLYMVKSILAQFRGEIWFESEENQGSVFYIVIPCCKLEEPKESNKR